MQANLNIPAPKITQDLTVNSRICRLPLVVHLLIRGEGLMANYDDSHADLFGMIPLSLRAPHKVARSLHGRQTLIPGSLRKVKPGFWAYFGISIGGTDSSYNAHVRERFKKG